MKAATRPEPLAIPFSPKPIRLKSYGETSERRLNAISIDGPGPNIDSPAIAGIAGLAQRKRSRSLKHGTTTRTLCITARTAYDEDAEQVLPEGGSENSPAFPQDDATAIDDS